MARFVLWDIDGTLLRSPGVGMAALHRAIERVTGRAPAETLLYAGMLDRNIALLYLRALDVDGEAHVEAVLAASLEALEASKSEIVQKGYLMPGVAEVLARLCAPAGHSNRC